MMYWWWIIGFLSPLLEEYGIDGSIDGYFIPPTQTF